MKQQKFITRKHFVGGRIVYSHQSRVTGGMFQKSTNLGKKIIVSSGRSGAKPMQTQVILEEIKPSRSRAAPKVQADARLVRPMEPRVGGNAELLSKIQAAFASKRRS